MLKAVEPSGKILFEEEQHYPGWIMWMVRVSFLVAFSAVLIAALTKKNNGGDWIGLAIVVPVYLLVFYFVGLAKFEKIVTTNGFYYRERPWQKKYRVIEKQSIDSADPRKFPFPSYGFGWFPGYGWYHNIGGEGVQLYLKNGNRFFFSSYERSSFLKALQDLIFAGTKSTASEF